MQITILDFLEIDEYKEYPPTKISNWRPSQAFTKKYLLPIFEHVKTLNNDTEIQEYFNNRFYIGRRSLAPYADFQKFLFGERECRMMSVIDDFKDFLFIANHTGLMFGGFVPLDNLIYPPQMSADKFRKSLTSDDKELIIGDLKRLIGLHNRNTSTIDYAIKTLNDYRIEIPGGLVEEK